MGSGTYEAVITSTLGRGEESGEEGELTVEHTRRLGGGLGAAGGGAGDEEDRWQPEKGTKGIRCCSASELQLRPPVGEEGDGGVDGHAGTARRRLWPCDSWRRGHGGARLRGGGRMGEGEAQGPRGEWGRVGGETEGRGVGVLIPSPRRRRGGFGWDAPCSDPGRGNRGRGRGAGAGPAGPASLAAGQGVGDGRAGGLGWLVQGASPPLFFGFPFFSFLFYSVLGHLGIL